MASCSFFLLMLPSVTCTTSLLACHANLSCLSRELFVDGTDASGKRVYDKVNGMTCHQCRQKTLGKHTTCSCCNSLQVTATHPCAQLPSAVQLNFWCCFFRKLEQHCPHCCTDSPVCFAVGCSVRGLFVYAVRRKYP